MHTKFAKRVTTASRSFTRTILDLTAQSDVISFAGGLPDAALFPRQSIQKYAQILLKPKTIVFFNTAMPLALSH